MLSQFASYQSQRGFSPQTVKRRRITLEQFSAFIAPLSLADATDTDVAEFLSRFGSPNTRKAYRGDLSAFYRWACRRKLLPDNPMDMIDPVRVPKPMPRPVPCDLVPQLVATAPDADTRLMIALAAFAGLRVAEIAALSVEDVDTSRNVLVVRHGKGGKDRLVPLHPTLRAMFSGRSTTAGPVFGVTATTVSRRIRNHLRDSGLPHTAHKLRASFLTEVARRSSGNLVMVQRLAGHDSPLTTMAYVGWDGGEAGAVVGGIYAA